jgi:tetratricopeptide (TPR) repeat protein
VDSAMIILNNILTKDPKNAKAYNKIGEIYGRIYHNFPKSFENLLKSYELNFRDLENLRNLGTAYGMQGDYQKSLKYLLEAEKVKPDDKDILYKLAITYKNLGDLKMCGEYARKAQ